MTSEQSRAEKRIRELLNNQTVAVLATQGGGQPHTSLMAYAFTDDLTNILIATDITTRKYQNMEVEPRVALLVDDREKISADFQTSQALTIIGEVAEMRSEEQDTYQTLFTDRHPGLKDFVSSPSTVLLQVTVKEYLLVSQFEDVMKYRPGDRCDENVKTEVVTHV